ncbi:hypothetical protein SAY87_024623 [Trapa incisa]|uniref:NAC domain-containing protein n=1 Tax=Trapa incisa TaxID=236973 RepID=A0AAN7G9Q3_9MYRT|nr:hypothetical protein SAY87_024623 [Trapa incisa]
MAVDSDSSLAICGGDWPPGFRFYPTDEELILYYLKRKICRKKLQLNIIAELDVYKWEPEELPGQSVLKTGDRQWYFFSARDRRYPNGARSNRATIHGYWKATGKDRNITSDSRPVGVKKTLVFYVGRAPSGQRTDWVMHEYTLDEEEFKRCQNVKDYYALYKVFKKSGPGPKNGEQYGAPFREEEWADDSEVVKTIDDRNIPEQLAECTSVDNTTSGSHLLLPATDDIEELLNQCIDELYEPPLDSVPLPVVPQSVSEEALTSLNSEEPLHQFQPRFKTNYLGISQPQQVVSSVLTCGFDNGALQHPSIEDFLEIDDLICTHESTSGNIENPAEKTSFEEVDELSELDLFHDAAMFLRDIGHLDEGNSIFPEMNLLNYGMVNESNYQVQQHPLVAADDGSNQLLVHDQRVDASFTQAEPMQGVQLRPSGFVIDTGSENLSHANQNQSSPEGGGGQMSWFSSAVWAFVESIPTNPASATENALVNRAFKRMPSFGRVRINSVPPNVASVSNDAIVRRSRKSSRGFILIYVVGVLGTLFGVLIGTLRLWERCVPS